MEIPRVDPVGVVHEPEGWVRRSRALPRGLRVTAAAVLLVFGLVATATTVASLGRYCLTSHASAPGPFVPR
jgi:hypothetical protein